MAGRFMDEMPGMSFGHAGTIVEGKEDTATEKIARLAEAGITVAEEISQIPEIMNSALTLYETRMTHAEIIIERDFRECTPILAMAGELRQVILNLIGNAVDAIGQGGRLKIRVTNAREHSNGSRPGIRMSIADTGSGIKPEVRKTLFEPFVSTKANMGTGLGLWISSEIVRKHGGTIQVKSSTLPPSTGSVFSVFLPLARVGVPASVLEEYATSNA